MKRETMMGTRGGTVKPSTVQEWMDNELARDEALRREVEETLNEMRIEQDLAALREQRKLSQHQLARILGISQPAVAKLESGRIKNLEIRTLVRYAVALGGKVEIAIKTDRRRARREGEERNGLKLVKKAAKA